MRDEEHLVAWLRDAHGMERATIDNIDRLLERMREYPEFVARYRTHLDESKAQLMRIEQALERFGTSPSTLKDATTRLTGWAEAYGATIADDEPLKHCLGALAYEAFEIASYLSLAAGADSLGEAALAQACKQSLAEERAMAAWLEDYIPVITQQFLQRGAQGARKGTESRPSARAH